MNDVNFGVFFIISFGFIVVGAGYFFLFRFFNIAENKLMGHLDKKSKTIINGLIFLVLFWGLKWLGEP
ncbi:hypothetical protein OFC87_23715 [Escherichia coli]|nr:hypothetical protein [Salmonella enterica subsp. enterica]EMD4683020.1 hypothetical protein [Salmonella enterica]MCV5230621.1 hypothetical protein [Escherichia coli]EMD4828592.1 hypothetical protein [Salmonella enterica]MCV5243530.1 hypothetical protein [Escherichia coli]